MNYAAGNELKIGHEVVYFVYRWTRIQHARYEVYGFTSTKVKLKPVPASPTTRGTSLGVPHNMMITPVSYIEKVNDL